MKMKRKPTKRELAVILAVHAAITALTWRDIARRPEGGIRGNPMAWRTASALNTAGSGAYWLFGRQSVTRSAPLS